MKIIFDHSTPRPARRYLPGHHCRTASEMGWERLGNGELLKAAEAAGFEILITCDRNLRYQQNLEGRRLAIIEITTNDWSLIRPNCDQVAQRVQAAEPSSYCIVEIALPPKPPYSR